MKKVLWLEDQFESWRFLIDDAADEGIDLIHFYTVAKLEEHLKKNWRQVDAIILDAMGFVNNRNEKPSTRALGASLVTILRAESNYNTAFPYFIYTGSLAGDDAAMVRAMIGEDLVFFKGEDQERLFKEVKARIANSVLFQAKEKYRNVLLLADEKYLGEDVEDDLIWMISHLTIESTDFDFNRIRRLIEVMYSRMAGLGFIPFEIKGNFTNCQKFLSQMFHGRDKTTGKLYLPYKHRTQYVPKIIGEELKVLSSIVQDASHKKDDMPLDIHTYIDESKGSGFYLFHSVILGCFEILIWYKKLVDNYPDIEKNNEMWGKLER